MRQYNLYNNIVGWIVFAIALITYTLTLEPTVSFWDAGEFISSADKLEVVHPMGAPFFALLGRIFILFAPDVASKAVMINFLSGLASAFTILFMFWSITAMGRKLITKRGETVTGANLFTVLGAGFIGATSGIFLDSFWFSATEGEVYALAAFFALLALWAMFKWDYRADDPRSDRWIIFISLMLGLSIGVHILSLLVIPALVYIFYFRRFKATTKGTIIAFIVSFGILAFLLWGVLDLFVKITFQIDKVFVNSFGLPFNIGMIFFILIVFGICGYFILYARRKRIQWLRTALLSFLMLIMGLSTYAMVVIRADANPPINMNDPSDLATLYSYLKREQYGSRPLVYGHYFTAQPLDLKNKGTRWGKDEESHKYIPIGTKSEYDFNVNVNDLRQRGMQEFQINQLLQSNKMTLFPRMGSIEGRHQRQYRAWVDLGPEEYPDFGDNMSYFFKYQLGYMYWRYFLWNFSGRQDDLQGTIDNGRKYGNWITGLRPVDEMRIGENLDLPESRNSDARNKFFMLPFILGLIGVIYHFSKDKKMAIVVFMLFFFTGLMNIINSNQPPIEPRERDYAVAISFIAYAMWIGIGVFSIFDYLRKKLSAQTAAIAATAVSLIVPVVLAAEGWDDHDRSGRYLARDSAINYLESLAPNAIVFTQGDNDTYPLWYVQEVERVRTDVRVINLSLLAVDWYIDQLHNKINDAPPINLTFDYSDYRGDQLMQVPVMNNPDYVNQYGTNAARALQFVKSDNPSTRRASQMGQLMDYIPTTKLTVPVNRAHLGDAGIPAEYQPNIVEQLEINFTEGENLFRDELMVLDIIASNAWERPIYFAITVDPSKHLGLDTYLQKEGLANRLVPVNFGSQNFHNTDIMYDNIMNKWQWGGLDVNDVYLDETASRTAKMLRGTMIVLAQYMMSEGNQEQAEQVLEKVFDVFPKRNLPFENVDELVPVVNLAMTMNKPELMNELLKEQLLVLMEDEFEYYYNAANLATNRNRYGGQQDFLYRMAQTPREQQGFFEQQMLKFLQYYNTLVMAAEEQNQTEAAELIRQSAERLEQKFNVMIINLEAFGGAPANVGQ